MKITVTDYQGDYVYIECHECGKEIKEFIGNGETFFKCECGQEFSVVFTPVAGSDE